MSIKVLIADDSRFNVRLLQEILGNEGFITKGVNDSTKVLEEAMQFKPDIILLDIVMPALDGFEVCKLLKEDSKLDNIPVIMITAKTESSDLKKALDIGAFDYIKKPVDEIEVVARIYSAFKYKTINDKLREMAMRDGLTGLYNHTLLIDLFQKEVSRSNRMNKDIAFIMMDIDHFKSINDNYGHMVGDEVLRKLSALITDTVRVSDIVGRYGGEEFSIVLSDISEEEVIEICERLRKNVEQYKFNIGDTAINITISIGVCIKKTKSMICKNDIIKNADEALYEAKRNGRNTCKLVIV